MTTETMIERVASAIAIEVARSQAKDVKGYVSYTDVARAALQALREPTEAMMQSVESDSLGNCSPDVADGWRKEYRRIFTTAIEAAFQEKAP